MMEFKTNRLGYVVRVNQVSHFLSGFRTITPTVISSIQLISVNHIGLWRSIAPKFYQVLQSQPIISEFGAQSTHLGRKCHKYPSITQKLKVIYKWIYPPGRVTGVKSQIPHHACDSRKTTRFHCKTLIWSPNTISIQIVFVSSSE